MGNSVSLCERRNPLLTTMKIIAAVCFIGVALAGVTPRQDALKPENPHEDPLPEMFLNLMKDVMVPPKEGSSTDPILKDIMSMVGSLAHTGRAPSSHVETNQ